MTMVTATANTPLQAIDLLPYQQAAVTCDARFTWNCWSRQTGKSFTFSLRRILRGIERRRSQFFLSAGERQSRELMTKARQHVEAMKLAAEFRELDLFEGTGFKQLEITLPDIGIRIVGLPANPNTARGFTGDVLLDEFAMHMLDREIWAAIFPTVMRGGGELDICSTPKGRANMFYMLARNEAFRRSHVTIDDAIAQGLEVDREELHRAMQDEYLWRQEFLCEFLDEATAFLTYELIGTCEDPALKRELDLAALAEHDGDVYVGVDIGRERNPTVIWVFDQVNDRLVHLGIIEMVGARFREQSERLSKVLRCKCVRRCCIDKSGLGMQMAEQAAEDFGLRVEGVQFTAPLKEQLAGDLLVKVQDSNVRIPVCDKMRNDLHSIQRSVTSAGHARYQAPQTGDEHADRFWALALAVHAATNVGGPVEGMLGPTLQAAGLRSW